MTAFDATLHDRVTTFVLLTAIAVPLSIATSLDVLYSAGTAVVVLGIANVGYWWLRGHSIREVYGEGSA